jgi:uncharacterized protein (DUF2252 family)
MSGNVVRRIRAFNASRVAHWLPLKYKQMRRDPFTFFRGTCHLFYEDWDEKNAINDAPPVWGSGDLHLNNFGSYKGDNRLVYFDVNDFDEAALIPCTWDLARLLTSILVGMKILGYGEADAVALADGFLNTYTHTLKKGRSEWVERASAKGLVRQLLRSLKLRSRRTFLDSNTRHRAKRRLRLDNVRFTAISDEKYQQIENAFSEWTVKPNDPEIAQYPEFYKVIDIAYRLAGVGSLGVERYAILVEGKGSPDCNFILDLKEQPGSSLGPYLTLKQPDWSTQAERVVTTQNRVQSFPPALLSALQIEEKSFTLRELQPYEDRVHTLQTADKNQLAELMQTMAQVTAWGQLRSSGRQGAAAADDLIHFGHQTQWQAPVLQYAQHYAKQVEKDFTNFAEAFDKGALKT